VLLRRRFEVLAWDDEGLAFSRTAPLERVSPLPLPLRDFAQLGGERGIRVSALSSKSDDGAFYGGIGEFTAKRQ
jgi:hypothetical protein